MNTMKTLMLAGFTALSIGAGTAMAQESGTFSPSGPDYWAVQAPQAGILANQSAHQAVQAGASDRTIAVDLGTQAFDEYNPFAGGN